MSPVNGLVALLIGALCSISAAAGGYFLGHHNGWVDAENSIAAEGAEKTVNQVQEDVAAIKVLVQDQQDVKENDAASKEEVAAEIGKVRQDVKKYLSGSNITIDTSTRCLWSYYRTGEWAGSCSAVHPAVPR